MPATVLAVVRNQNRYADFAEIHIGHGTPLVVAQYRRGKHNTIRPANALGSLVTMYAADCVPRLVPTSQTGILACPLNHAMTALGRTLPVRRSVDHRNHQALLSEYLPGADKKIAFPPLKLPFGKICSPPWPPAKRTTAAWGLLGASRTKRCVTPARGDANDTLRLCPDNVRVSENPKTE